MFVKGLPAGNDRSGIERMGVREAGLSVFSTLFILLLLFYYSPFYSYFFFGRPSSVVNEVTMCGMAALYFYFLHPFFFSLVVEEDGMVSRV